MKKATITIVIILSLILIFPGLRNWLSRAKSPNAIQGSTQFEQKAETTGNNPKITTLDLDSFRLRLKVQGQNIRASESAPLVPTATSMPATILVIANGLVIDGTGAVPTPNGMVVVGFKKDWD